MKTRYWQLGLILLFTLSASAQVITRQNLASIMGFENGRPGASPAGWSAASGVYIDDTVFHGGKYSARVERTASSSSTSSGISVAIPMDFLGEKLEFRGFIKSEGVSNAVAIYIREDGDKPSLAFASTQMLGVKGTTDWAEYSISVPFVPEARQLYLGFLVIGTGKGWVDDLQLLVDGKPVAQAPGRYGIDNDHEFDNGSNVSPTSLSATQVKNLAKLAKVWGFLKYHHPKIASGTRHWDYDLFRILPAVLAAADGAAANGAISAWIAGFGTVANCTTCATLKTTDLYMSPDLDWIADEALLGAGLSQTLRSIHRNRPADASQFYVSLAPYVGNPVFDHELTYQSLRLPDAGYQMLALFRFWNMVQYFYPNRDVMADDPKNDSNYWNNVLEASIPDVALAQNRLEYQQAMLRFIAKINDTHANLWSSLSARPPIGACKLPVVVRFIEGVPLIVEYAATNAEATSGLKIGDVIEKLDGAAVPDLLEQWRPLYADSNEAARLRDIGNNMTAGACGPATVAVRRGGGQVGVQTTRVAASTLVVGAGSTHDRPGDAFQMLTSDVAYVKISTAKAASSAAYIQSAAGTKGLIIDIRNYPSDFPIFSLGALLVSEKTNFVRFTNGDVSNPGAMRWGVPVALEPQPPHYNGKVVILVDEVTQSSAEYHAMAFRAVPGAVVIGSTTAGADGNVSTIPLPAGLSSYISGLGVYYPDGRPTQRVGIVPDIVVKPTIAGISAGRDELIEEAWRQIVGGI